MKFYAHIDPDTLKIVAVNPSTEFTSNTRALEIDEELAVKFLTGEESPDKWVLIKKKDEYFLEKLDDTIHFSRTECSKIELVSSDDSPEALVNIKIKKGGACSIKFDAKKIKMLQKFPKFFVTEEEDPSYIQMIIDLDPSKGLKSPVNFQIPNPDDFSIYWNRANIKVNLS